MARSGKSVILRVHPPPIDPHFWPVAIREERNMTEMWSKASPRGSVRWCVLTAAIGLCLAAGIVADAEATSADPRHALSIGDEPKYGPDFPHFDYVNPDAPKGGAVTIGAIGSFDTLNPFTLLGVAAAGSGLIYDTLMTASDDEPFAQYGLLAASVEVAPDGSWAAFNLRPEARFHDGHPVTADDVLFSFETLRENYPLFRSYYANVAGAIAEGPQRVLFTFQPGDNRELPLILGQLPVLPEHYWEGKDFSRTTLEPPLGGGPYRIASVNPGRSISYERVEDYWGGELPVNVGRHNFNRLSYEYYLDGTVLLQAFKRGLIDFRQENIARNWATAYDIPEVRDGRMILEEIPNSLPAGMQAFVYNTRRPVFADPAVRAALAHAFDFNWLNANLFYGAYERTDSYFENSELAAAGLPNADELKILEPMRGRLPDDVFLKAYEPPSTEGPNGIRRNLLAAQRMLDEAGWVLRDGTRVNASTGEPLAFEILLVDPNFERIALPFVQNLARLGVKATVRTIDTAQYQNRLQNFDFDMVTHLWPQSLSPGNEQRDFWGSAAADRPGSENLAGIKDPTVDALIELVVQAPDRDALVTRVRALDRALLWGHYVIPQWHSGVFRVAYWSKLARPETLPPYGLAFDAWWVDPTTTR